MTYIRPKTNGFKHTKIKKTTASQIQITTPDWEIATGSEIYYVPHPEATAVYYDYHNMQSFYGEKSLTDYKISFVETDSQGNKTYSDIEPGFSGKYYRTFGMQGINYGANIRTGLFLNLRFKIDYQLWQSNKSLCVLVRTFEGTSDLTRQCVLNASNRSLKTETNPSNFTYTYYNPFVIVNSY